jgi:hypothetical protein
MVLRDVSLNDNDAFAVFKSLLEDVLTVGGVFVANLHPHNFAERLELYDRIAGEISRKKEQGAKLSTAEKLIRQFREKNPHLVKT